MAIDLLSQLEECLWPNGFGRGVWMIVDSARDPRIYGLLLECFYSSHSCLFAGTLAPELKLTAPYLIPLDYDDKKTRRFLNYAWGNSWGTLLKCHARQDALRRHLRGLLTVRDPHGQRLLFRFYDPRVLRTYLPTCNSEELEHVFGPIECFWTDSKTKEHALEFHFIRDKLVQRTISLVPGAPPQSFDRDSPKDDGQPPRRPALLAIRPAQIAAFSQAELQKFEDWMCAHLRQFFPRQCDALKDPNLRDLIQYGIERAAEHHITSERDVCKFIDLMIVFGRDFDTGKRLAWPAQILANRKTARAKIRALYEAAATQLGR